MVYSFKCQRFLTPAAVATINFVCRGLLSVLLWTGGELSTKPSRPILALECVSTFYQGCVCPRKYRYQVRIWVASLDVPPSLRERVVFGAFWAPPSLAF